MDEPIGLIAAQGPLPVLAAQGMIAAGRRVMCVGLGDVDPQLIPLCERYQTVGIARIGKWIRLLRKWNVTTTVLVGYVRKSRMYDPFRVLRLRHIPDLRTIRMWYRKLRHDRRSNSLLRAVAFELEQSGITMTGVAAFIPQHISGQGVLTNTQPTPGQWDEIGFGVARLRRLGELDIGQAIAVRGQEVVAVEALEGTDAVIRRAGRLCRTEPWTLLKAPKSTQDLRLDQPVIGERTIENLKAAGASCLAIEAGRVIMIDKPNLIAAADRMGIAIVGVKL
jgi:DUF1009 family protein